MVEVSAASSCHGVVVVVIVPLSGCALLNRTPMFVSSRRVCLKKTLILFFTSFTSRQL